MAFSPSFIERLRAHFLLSEVIGRRIAVKRFGREYKALCPFHKEKTPSFTVNDEKGFYHCFGCGAHGDVISFLREYEKLGYLEAVESLAKEAGIPVPRFQPSQEEKSQPDLYAIMEAACVWFQQQFAIPAHTRARDYIGSRALAAQSIERFRLGYAPAERDALKRHLLKTGHSESKIMEAGLIIRPDDGATYDRFRDRIIFPIRDTKGRVVAFGGRILPSSRVQDVAKYLNSPETPLFRKGEMLFNLDQAQGDARRLGQIVLVEGYMDVIALHQAGITAVVAPLGTALTKTQLPLLWKLAEEPTICLDGDSAGIRAMLRAAEMALPLLQPGKSLRFARLPAGEDPDTLIRRYGISGWEACLRDAIPLCETLWNNLLNQFPPETPEKMAKLEKHAQDLARQIADSSVRAWYASYFKQQVWQAGRQTRQPALRLNKKRSPAVAALAQGGEETALQFQSLEKALLALVLLYPELLQRHEVEETLARIHFSDHRLGTLRERMLQACLDVPEEEAKDLPFAALKRQIASLGSPQKAWEELLGAYAMSQMMQEHRHTADLLGSDVQGSTEKIEELQKHIKEASLRRYRHATEGAS